MLFIEGILYLVGRDLDLLAYPRSPWPSKVSTSWLHRPAHEAAEKSMSTDACPLPHALILLDGVERLLPTISPQWPDLSSSPQPPPSHVCLPTSTVGIPLRSHHTCSRAQLAMGVATSRGKSKLVDAAPVAAAAMSATASVCCYCCR